MYKRINKENVNFLKHPLNKTFTFEIYYTLEYNYMYIVIKNKKTKSEQMRLQLPKNFPFKPPTIFIYDKKTNLCDINYSQWSLINGDKFYQFINKHNISIFDILLLCFFVINKNIHIIYKIPDFSFLFKQECLCCSSISRDNWNLSSKITDIFTEYCLRKDLFSISNKYQLKYIRSIFNNERWSLPFDLIEYILKYLI